MGHAPENTPASFELGWRMGADALECDVHFSRDRRLVVMHDETLDRTSNGTGLIKELPWSALRRLDAGSWYHRRFRGQRIWRLEDLLGWMRNKKARAGHPLRLVLEIKNHPIRYPGISDAVVRALKRARFLDRAIVISFDHAAVRRAKVLAPELAGGILVHKRLPDLIARAKAFKADAVFPRWSLVTQAMLKQARGAGLFVGVWTVNGPAEIRKMLRLGVDGIASNYPDRVARLLKV
jgi:glycerophosphoryl diester phosphodiesterase